MIGHKGRDTSEYESTREEGTDEIDVRTYNLLTHTCECTNAHTHAHLFNDSSFTAPLLVPTLERGHAYTGRERRASAHINRSTMHVFHPCHYTIPPPAHTSSHPPTHPHTITLPHHHPPTHPRTISDSPTLPHILPPTQIHPHHHPPTTPTHTSSHPPTHPHTITPTS